MPAKNDGSTSQSIFETIMGAKPKTWVWRNRDMKDLMGINRGRRVATFAAPADYTVGHGGELFWCEVKSTLDPKRFNYGQIENGQRQAACISATIGTPYLFIIHSLKLNKWFQLTGAQFAADVKAGVKSRTFEELEPCTFITT